MEELFSPRYQWLWTAVLALALFIPVRQLIWILSVRREQRQRQGELPDEERRAALKSRAGVTSALLCFVFSVLYVNMLMGRLHGAP
ncbi:MAG: hypothetical protein EA406_12765 [Rhodospirillales bacterium]|nr:MAG: hypothetical protein EA406_12765 [Rhodospirillales bacterium]